MTDRIDAAIDSTDTVSPVISGSKLLQPGSKAQNSLITAQVVPDGTGAFEVTLDAAVNSVHGPSFQAIGTFEDSDDTYVTVFPVSLGGLYRFTHVSGIACRVLLAG